MFYATSKVQNVFPFYELDNKVIIIIIRSRISARLDLDPRHGSDLLPTTHLRKCDSSEWRRVSRSIDRRRTALALCPCNGNSWRRTLKPNRRPPSVRYVFQWRKHTHMSPGETRQVCLVAYNNNIIINNTIYLRHISSNKTIQRRITLYRSIQITVK